MSAEPEVQGKVPAVKKRGGRLGGMKESFFENQIIALSPFLPGDLVGGGIPYIAGTEEEAVWNAACQACGTERVHYTYTVFEDRCWYLATPSSSLASSPDTWCPLAAALPGNSEYWDQETIYMYEQEGAAGAIRWDRDTGRMQVFLGAARTILPRVQSLDANFVTIDPETATPVPWKNRALNQERLSRMAIKALLFSGLLVTFISLMILVGSYALANIMTPQLTEAKKVTAKATEKLLIDASIAQQSNTNKHLARIIELFKVVGSFGGTLVKYEVTGGNTVVWEALIPSAVKPSQLKATALGAEKDGRIRIQGKN